MEKCVRREVDRTIHFVFFGFNSGMKRAIRCHSHPTNLAYIWRHRFPSHTMGSVFLLPVDRNLFPVSQTFLLRNYLRNVTTTTLFHCWKLIIYLQVYIYIYCFSQSTKIFLVYIMFIIYNIRATSFGFMPSPGPL